jgi:sec-independent protein translocase protein TatA
LLIPGVGWGELLIIVVIILLIFGGKKIPDLMRSMGEGVREFKKASKELTEEEPPKPPKEKSESEKLREAAQALGISTEGKSDEEIRTEVSSKVKE